MRDLKWRAEESVMCQVARAGLYAEREIPRDHCGRAEILES